MAQVASPDNQGESHQKSMLQCQEVELDDALTKVTSTMHGIVSEFSYSVLYFSLLIYAKYLSSMSSFLIHGRPQNEAILLRSRSK